METQRSLTPNYVLITTTVSIVPSAHYLPLTSSFACFSFCHHLYCKIILIQRPYLVSHIVFHSSCLISCFGYACSSTGSSRLRVDILMQLNDRWRWPLVSSVSVSLACKGQLGVSLQRLGWLWSRVCHVSVGHRLDRCFATRVLPACIPRGVRTSKGPVLHSCWKDEEAVPIPSERRQHWGH